MVSKMFAHDAYQNANGHLQAFTNGSEYLNYKSHKSLTIKYLQNKPQSDKSWNGNVLFSDNIVGSNTKDKNKRIDENNISIWQLCKDIKRQIC
jgi:hypothetical protein